MTYKEFMEMRGIESQSEADKPKRGRPRTTQSEDGVNEGNSDLTQSEEGVNEE